MNAHEIDYHIYGEEMQYVEVELDPQEGVVAEAGSFMMMNDGITMNTIFGDGSNQDKGVLGKLFSAGKRLLTGESLFMTVFTNTGYGKKKVSFASPYPGKIVPIDLSELEGSSFVKKMHFYVLQKESRLELSFLKG
jgi:uncharacterized protein (AIM24 family)